MESGRAVRKRKEACLGKLVLERGGYVCHAVLGQGAFSVVYCVERKSDARTYACKVSENIPFLEKEADILAKLSHRLFPVFLLFWTEAGLGFLLTEWVPGTNMEKMLCRRGNFSAAATLRAGRGLAEGLSYLHKRPERFLFRDVKPANVIVCQDGRVRLVDLGCVCSMREKVTSRAGTPGFAAPEQFHDHMSLTASCDVYGLGQTLKVMLGNREESGGSGKNTMGRREAGDPGQKRRRRKLEGLLEDCTKENVSQRISDMDEVRRRFALM